MEHNSFTYFGKILARIIWDFLYFPVWWYSAGFINILKSVGHFYKQEEASLSFLVWLKNLFVPMYGQNDMMGRLISFFIRLIQIIFRGVIMFIIIILGLVFIAFYLSLPFLILLAILRQLY